MYWCFWICRFTLRHVGSSDMNYICVLGNSHNGNGSKKRKMKTKTENTVKNVNSPTDEFACYWIDDGFFILFDRFLFFLWYFSLFWMMWFWRSTLAPVSFHFFLFVCTASLFALADAGPKCRDETRKKEKKRTWMKSGTENKTQNECAQAMQAI